MSAPAMTSQMRYKSEKPIFIMAISKERLEELYVKEKLSIVEVSKLCKRHPKTISKLLQKNDIKKRTFSEQAKLSRKSFKYISEENLKDFYWGRKLSIYQISEKVGCSPSGIFYKLKKFNIPLRTLSEGIELSIARRSKSISRSITKYAKKDFDGGDIEKAYMIGFRLGDLHVFKNKYGETIYVSSGTSKQEQLDLMDSLFEKYGKISKYNLKSGCTQFSCNLNMSFDFLLPKNDEIPKWIISNDKNFISFLAGYVDAEGHFGVYNNFAEFSVSTYDSNILFTIHKKLNKLDVYNAEPKISVKEGYVDKRGVRCNGTLYRLRITRKTDLLNFILLIKSCIKHAKRLTDLKIAENNILERNKRV